jgi:DNA-binding IscR family transcriptional regulator
MNLDLRLSTALHVLLRLIGQSAPVTSQALAHCVRTNPVVVRTTMAGLRKAGIVSAEKGHGGGWSLARAPTEITLGEVQIAIGKPVIFAMGARRRDQDCLVEQVVESVLSDALREAEAVLMQRLAAVRLSQLSAELRQRAGERNHHHHHHIVED